MAEPLTSEYIVQRTDQINAAIAEGDSDLVAGLIARIRADGNTAFADLLVDVLVERAQNLSGGSRF